jgi:RHS repeat-associated protein
VRRQGAGTQPSPQHLPEFYLFSDHQPLAEYDDQFKLVRRYLHDDMGQLVHFQVREASGAMASYFPVMHFDDSPWLLWRANAAVATLPTPPGFSGAATSRADYFLKKLPLLHERHEFSPFGPTALLRYDYSSGTGQPQVVVESDLPLSTQGRRWHATDRLLYYQRRFYDPALQDFISPDPGGAWADPRSFGNAHAASGRNPVGFGDDGGLAWFVPVLLYLGYCAITAAVETVLDYGMHRALGNDEEFSFSQSAGRNFALGIATNWIPVGFAGRVGGRFAWPDGARAGLP